MSSLGHFCCVFQDYGQTPGRKPMLDIFVAYPVANWFFYSQVKYFPEELVRYPVEQLSYDIATLTWQRCANKNVSTQLTNKMCHCSCTARVAIHVSEMTCENVARCCAHGQTLHNTAPSYSEVTNWLNHLTVSAKAKTRRLIEPILIITSLFRGFKMMMLQVLLIAVFVLLSCCQGFYIAFEDGLYFHYFSCPFDCNSLIFHSNLPSEKALFEIRRAIYPDLTDWQIGLPYGTGWTGVVCDANNQRVTGM